MYPWTWTDDRTQKRGLHSVSYSEPLVWFAIIRINFFIPEINLNGSACGWRYFYLSTARFAHHVHTFRVQHSVNGIIYLCN